AHLVGPRRGVANRRGPTGHDLGQVRQAETRPPGAAPDRETDRCNGSAHRWRDPGGPGPADLRLEHGFTAALPRRRAGRGATSAVAVPDDEQPGDHHDSEAGGLYTDHLAPS